MDGISSTSVGWDGALMSVRRADGRRGGEGRLAREQWAVGGLPHRCPTTGSLGLPARLLCDPSVRSTTEIMDLLRARDTGQESQLVIAAAATPSSMIRLHQGSESN